MLYGVTSDGAIWTIDAGSGKATQKSKLSMKLPEASAVTVDFNPVADRLRVIGADGTNLRINVEDGIVAKDGDLKFADADMHKSETPKVVAGAYSNSFKGAKETALYDVDATIGGLLKQAPPNDGVLNAIGKLGSRPAPTPSTSPLTAVEATRAGLWRTARCTGSISRAAGRPNTARSRASADPYATSRCCRRCEA